MSRTTDKLRVAMIGAGDITALQRPAYIDCDDAELVAICDVNTELLAQRRSAWGVTRATTDYRELLRDPDIDIVEVNLPHHLHAPVVIEALAAGKHVACQKPMATSVGHAAAMVRAAEKSRGHLRILENFVFYPPYVRAKELLDAGEIGAPLTVRFKLGSSLFGSRWIPLRSELWHLTEVEKGMGQAVFDDGYHKLSLAIFFLGPVQSVKGFIGRSLVYVDEPAQLMWQYRNCAALGSFDAAFSPNLFISSKYFPADERIDIVGTHGILRLKGCTGRLTDDAPLALYRRGQRFLFEDLETDWQASFTAAIRDFPRAIKEGRDTLLSGHRGLEVVRFAYALIVAARTGTEVCPDEVTDDLVRERLHLGAASGDRGGMREGGR